MIVGDAAENTEVKILMLTLLRPLSESCSETARSRKCLEIPGAEEKTRQEKEKKKKGQHIFPQDDKKGTLFSGSTGEKLPAEKIPHQNSAFVSLQSDMLSQKKTSASQQISSGRPHKIKDLKNEIFDLEHKLEALSLENHFLKQLQCRHSKAIGRSNLPGLLARHYNEVKTLQELLGMSQKDERNSSRKLRKVEAELQKTKEALQILHMLSEDKTLAEREELEHRLSVLTEKMEVNDKRIQSLEKQLKLNNSTFSHQLANENKKVVEAGIITKNLQMEINSLHQKIKEKDRQLYVNNIYANKMPKILEEKSDSVTHEKSLSINRSVQVDEQSFGSLLLSQHQTEKEKSPIYLTQEKKSSEDKNRTTKVKEAYTDARCRTEKSSIKKIQNPETFNRMCRDYLRERTLLMEENTCLEFMKEEKETDLLKWEIKKLVKTEEILLSDSGKENNQEKDAVEEYEKEEKKTDEELSSSEKVGSKYVTPHLRNKTPIRLKKTNIFPEATENLHRGLLTLSTKPKKGSLCSHRQAGQDCSEAAESKVKKSFRLYEPSFGKVTKTRLKDRCTEVEGCAHMTFAERQKVL
ncbi:PREDICTED: lebercilin-like protein [Merops nubicus]|uniref:lebercilin-like protein n=1 Tax=Merops nubicus TaxID=57421 RepID=UPI0004F06773|nr:PREDICTED: lebercilin-like protein [Merops nubicus]